MAEQSRYWVYGNFDGKRIDIQIDAYSERQAKFKAAIDYGYGGGRLAGFMKKVKCRRVKG